MALPKRRHSRERGRLRRTHYKLKKPNLSTCSNCNAPKLPHRICSVCGYYRGKPVLQIKKKEKKPKR
ncbi:MAG: 50S ribosomal protein L32 [Candidatus Omnitrophica bacterium]|nr:50S ribosomal protein L32 [Candidatus Omnitrophota bacterium]